MPEDLYVRKEYRSLLFRYLDASPKLRIIDFFLDNPFSDYTKDEIMKSLAVSRSRFFKY